MSFFFAPSLAPILRSKKVSLALLSVTGIHLLLTYFGLPGWRCPLLHTLGIPCPGCGLTRASFALLRGDWQEALTIHAFAFFMPLALVLISAGLLPTHHKQQFIVQVEKIERRTGIAMVLFLSLIAYWFVRLVFFRVTFVRVIVG